MYLFITLFKIYKWICCVLAEDIFHGCPMPSKHALLIHHLTNHTHTHQHSKDLLRTFHCLPFHLVVKYEKYVLTQLQVEAHTHTLPFPAL